MALMCAERGCLVFRDQDFGNIGFEKQKEIARHFGKIKDLYRSTFRNGLCSYILNRTSSQARVDASPQGRRPLFRNRGVCYCL
jgi:sulfonate dioxygenase